MIAAVHAEWVKATSLRPVLAGLLAYVVAAAGISIGVVAAVGAEEAAGPGYDAGTIAFYGLNFAHVAVVVVAVLLTAGEYSRSTVHTSLLAVPRRGVLLLAKVVVVAGLVFAAAAVAAVVSVVGTQAVLGPAGLPVGDLTRSTVAATLYPTLLAVLCAGVAMVLRDQAGALTLLIPFFFLVSPLLELVPVLQRAAVFLPDRAGAVAVRLHPRPVDVFGPLTGLAVLALWALAAVLAGWWVLRRRDA
ncbi:ABC transporter permease [Modestobacter versicolor]|uniref:ABC transporter permease n=1 Tax=Modestobacter versicolor TaxID=429133 RepID=UPI0034DEED0F